MTQRRITMADVAKQAQVSTMTVSRVLNNKPGVSEEMRRSVLDTAKRLGYEFNISLPNAPRFIALLVPDFATPYVGEVLHGIAKAAEEWNYGLGMLTVRNTDPFQLDYFKATLSASMSEGMIMIAPHNYETIARELKERDMPFIIVDHRSEVGDELSVSATNHRGTLEAMRYLLALGHRRIGFIKGRMEIACSHDRFKGYQAGLAEVGLPFDPELVRQGDFRKQSGFEQAKSLLGMEKRPTAIIVSNDIMAFGAMDAARQANLCIGSDISIIGFDDIFMAQHSFPPLTTVRQPLSDMGRVALDTLVSMLEGRKISSRKQELSTELIVRETTGPVPSP